MSKKNKLTSYTLKTYLMKNELRENKFCEVYMGVDTRYEENPPVEVKVVDMSQGFNIKMLEYESRVRRELVKNDYLFKYIEKSSQGNLVFQVCEHPGSSLDMLIKASGCFSMQTVVLTIYEMVCIIEKIHKEKFLIRSISPENISIGLGDKIKNFHILDCFYFKKYWDTRTGQHIPCIEGKPLLREPLFATTHEHLGIEASRRDDLESLAYLALYMFVGSLPWKENVTTDNPKENYPVITSKKLNLSPETLFTGFPYQFAVLLKYAKGLRFDEVPDYEWLKSLFSDLFNTLNYKVSLALDWVKDGVDWLHEAQR